MTRPRVTAQPVPILSDNYAWLLHEASSGAVAIVDPADAAAVSAAIDAAGGRLDLILLTHHHADHTTGTDEVRARYGAKVAGAAADAHRLPHLDLAVRGGDAVAFGAATARVIETPGHTLGHIAYFFPAGNVLLCGDTLFSLGCGKLLEGTAADMYASLRALAALPPDTLVCCGHEYTQNNARFALSLAPDHAALLNQSETIARKRAAGLPTVPSLMADEIAANPFLLAASATELGAIRAAKDRF
jgi:hydroxyacylglutathione hydrolase